MSRREAEEDQQQAGGVDRQDLEREERQQQAEAADDAGSDGARVPELHGQAEHAEREQQVGDLRMRDGAEEPLPPRHLDALHFGVRRCRSVTVRPSKRRIVRPSSCRSRSSTSAATKSMSGGVAVERFAVGERAAFSHGLGGERRRCGRAPRASERAYAAASDATFSAIVSSICCAGARHRVRGADVRARRHHGDVGGERDDEAGGRGARAGRADEDDDRRARGDHARDDRARRVEQAAGRAQDEDDDVGARRVRLVDDAVQVLGGDGMDDAVELGDQRQRTFGDLRGRDGGRR